MINWNASKEDHALAARIAERAVKVADKAFGAMSNKEATKFQRETLMDVIAVHANGCPLQLAELLRADQTDFVHDIFGIRRHIDRETGKLKDFFLPRYAGRQGVAA